VQYAPDYMLGTGKMSYLLYLKKRT
jgi:hypothetical protein